MIYTYVLETAANGSLWQNHKASALKPSESFSWEMEGQQNKDLRSCTLRNDRLKFLFEQDRHPEGSLWTKFTLISFCKNVIVLCNYLQLYYFLTNIGWARYALHMITRNVHAISLRQHLEDSGVHFKTRNWGVIIKHDLLMSGKMTNSSHWYRQLIFVSICGSHESCFPSTLNFQFVSLVLNDPYCIGAPYTQTNQNFWH